MLNNVYISQDFKSVLLSGISFVSDVIEICSVTITIGNESIYVLRIFRLPDKVKLPEWDVILNNVLS